MLLARNLLRRPRDSRKKARSLAFNKRLYNFFFIFEIIVDISEAISAFTSNIAKFQLMEPCSKDAALGSINDLLAMLLERVRRFFCRAHSDTLPSASAG